MKNKKFKNRWQVRYNNVKVRSAMRRIKDFLKKDGHEIKDLKQDSIIQKYCTVRNVSVRGISLRDWAVLAYETDLLPDPTPVKKNTRVAKPINRPTSKVAEKMKRTNDENETPHEKIFAAKLDALGIEYERNKIFNHEYGVYMPDFFIPTRNIIIEIDGSQHRKSEGAEYDVRRDTWFLKTHGTKTFRFSNQHVKYQSLEFVKLFLVF